MPRRALTSVSSTPIASSPPPPGQSSSSHLTLLRQQWKWAAFGQFFFTFSPLFNMNDVSIGDIEFDLTNSTNIVLPRIMQRLLYTLTQDRKISPETWQAILRRQYIRRDPMANPFDPEPSNVRELSMAISNEGKVDLKAEDDMVSQGGDGPSSLGMDKSEDVQRDTSEKPTTEPKEQEQDVHETEESVQLHDWRDLPMLVRLDSMHRLAEWHFQNPNRIRTLMRDDDETAQWRIEPIGYDAKTNAYWLIGWDRLWIQRAPPKLPKTLKRKRAAPQRSTKSNTSQKRRRAQPVEATSSKSAPSNGRRSTAQPSGGKGARAAKLNANRKLDVQAKELAEFQQQAAAASKPSPPKRAAPRTVGTRVSARLRGPAAEEGWQLIPDEWLAESVDHEKKAESPNRTVPKTGLESDEDSISDLTELSEENAPEKRDDANDSDNGTPALDDAMSAQDDHASPEEPLSHQEDFTEWETICVNLQEWDRIAERFEKSTHYAEKALYKVLVKTVVPAVTSELREIDRKRRLEEAVVHRKRSSRIAIKESVKEEAKAAARKKAEESEKMSRARRLEARLLKEEADRVKRENAREQRRQEREEKEKQEQEEQEKVTADEHANIPIYDDQPAKAPSNGVTFRANSGSGSGSHTPVGDDWELDCEVCHKRGINQDDGQPVVCCGGCSKWQHIPCHDKADAHAGRSRRNWDLEEFFCQRCRPRAQSSYPSQHPSSHYSPQTVTNNYGPAAARSYNIANAPSHNYPSRPITFTHYQPQQRGFSSTETYQSGGTHRAPSHGHTTPSSHAHPHHLNGNANHPRPSQQLPYVPPNDPQHANSGWNGVAPPSQVYSTSHGAFPQHVDPTSDYNYNKQYGPDVRWQNLHHLPLNQSNQQSQLLYHQSMGSAASYYPPS